VIDHPGVAEKKSFPSRILLTLLVAFIAFVTAAAVILIRDRWSRVDAADPRRKLVTEVFSVFSKRLRPATVQERGAA
jgi:hypothetical protein